MSQNVVSSNQSYYRQFIISHVNKSLFNLVTKSQIIFNLFNQIFNENEKIFVLSNVHRNRSNSINESFHKKIKHEFFTRRVKFEKKIAKKRFAKIISKSSISLSTITNLSKLITQLDCYIDKQRDFIDEITSKFRCVSKIVVKIKTLRNAKKINNIFKKNGEILQKNRRHHR